MTDLPRHALRDPDVRAIYDLSQSLHDVAERTQRGSTREAIQLLAEAIEDAACGHHATAREHLTNAIDYLKSQMEDRS